MNEEKISNIDVDKFIFQKLYEEFTLIEKIISEKEKEILDLDKDISDLKINLGSKEIIRQTLEGKVKILKENKSKLKEKHEEIKKIIKI